MDAQPLIAVRDDEAASRWYQPLLGCASGHGGSAYERLLDGEPPVLQLHDWGIEHDRGAIGDPDATPRGNGVLPWCEVADFDAR
jgi:hypothetical protein